jgi:CBS domain-containing protein
MNELQYKMNAKSSYQPSKTVEALFTTALVKIKADADKAVAKQKTASETEVVSAKDGVEVKAKETILEHEMEPKTVSFVQTGTNETKPKAEEVSRKEATEKFENEAAREAGTIERKAQGADTAFEEVVEIEAESREPAEGEVSGSIRQMVRSQSNQPREKSLAGSGLCAKDVMLKELAWVSPEDSVQQAIIKMQQYDSGYLLVGKDGVLEGIVSNSNIKGALSPYLRPVFAKWRRPLDDATLQIRIKWIMSRPVHIVKPQTPLTNVMDNMCRLGVLCLPVVDTQGKVQGLVTEAGIFKVLLGLTGSPDISTSDIEHRRQFTFDQSGLESTPTMEPNLVTSV